MRRRKNILLDDLAKDIAVKEYTRKEVIMPRADFERNLQQVQDDIVQLSSMVEKAILKSVEALKSRDLKLSEQVIKEDDAIDRYQERIEELCIDMIALEAPMAGDLRAIITVLMVASELERMGDYAEGIAKLSLAMGDAPPLKPLIDIPRMMDRAIHMLKHGIESFINKDADMARKVIESDDEIDDLYEQIYRELLTYMMADPTTIERATYLLWVSHDLERVADRATNIAERVIYLATGKLI